MNLFVDRICQLTLDALHHLDSERVWTTSEIQGLIEQPPDADMGDFALPCFSFSKKLQRSPKQIAEELQNLLVQEDPQEQAFDAQKRLPFSRIQAFGPYLNFFLHAEILARELLPSIFNNPFSKGLISLGRGKDRSEKNRQKVMIEFSQPNTHKGFHVGHLRNAALGDSLCRIHRFNGYEVVGANYFGDVGTHIAKCLWYYLNHCKDSPPEELRGEWLGELYTQSVHLLETLEGEEAQKAQAEISSLLRKMEEKDPELSKVWDETRQWSMDDFEEIYRWLDIRFDHYFYESDVDEEGRQMVLQGEMDGTFILSEGAIGIDLEEENLGFFMLLKSDGNTLYSTKDLALARRKFDQFSIDRSVYVVGAEQTLHFKQVFATLKRLGYAQAEHCYHLPYALVMLPSGKMSSRAGNVILFSEMRKKMREFILQGQLAEQSLEWGTTEVEETAHRIALAAIKYGMLSQDPNKPIVFSMEDWLVSEGDTGTYLVYAYVRIRSIGRQVALDVGDQIDFALLEHPNEKLLMRRMLDFESIVWKSGEQFKPSLLARYLYELCRDFSKAYGTCSVKHAESESLQAARLLLFHCVAEVLKTGLGLLGITPPERM